jgi:betaine-aldehyde dehydrogenase
VDQIRFFAGAARVLEGRAAAEYMTGHTSFIRREPVGVCGQVTPWNYPLMMAVWKIAPALAAGNTVVLKPSDTTPLTTVMLAELAGEFLPPGVFNVVCGDRDSWRAVIGHKTPAMVSITGSVRAGMEVAASASSDVKRVHLELGGKAPVVVFDDADVRGRGRYRSRRLFQRRAGLHGVRVPRSRCTTTSSPPSPSGEEPRHHQSAGR